MKKFQVVQIENDSVRKQHLQIGDNVISRGVATESDDGRIIKQAATINFLPTTEMTITPVAPCYMKSTDSSKWKLLELGTTVPIKPGDVCSLLPDKCWFKIISVPTTMESESALKRKVLQQDYFIPAKKVCPDSGAGDNAESPSNILKEMLGDNNVTLQTKDQEDTINKMNLPENRDIANADVVDVKNVDTASSTDEDKTCAPSANSRSENNSSVTPRNIPSDVVQEDRQSASTNVAMSGSKRVRCVYGNKCYRKNPQHKAKFSHVGDSDYDVPDDRKECPYGVKCYRKNPQHKIEFKHATGSTRHKRTPIQITLHSPPRTDESSAEDSMEESVDESEYEPSNAESSSEEIYSDKYDSDFID